jgi:hypothetical protein
MCNLIFYPFYAMLVVTLTMEGYMKRVIFLVLIVLLFQVCAYAAGNSGQVPANQAPTVTEIIGDKTDAVLGPAFYPRFYDIATVNGDTACEPYLINTLSLAPICTPSSLGNGNRMGECKDFTTVDGLKTDLEVPLAYRKSAKILIAWTVRIDGYKKKYPVHSDLCKNWYGDLKEEFPKGTVKTALYINNNKFGIDITMEVPTAGYSTVHEMPPPPPSSGGFDPTLTGTYVLKASDFGGEFPAVLKDVEIRWKNETTMRLESAKGNRRMMINFMPISKQ